MTRFPGPCDAVEVSFASLVYGGWALGRLADGRALFAPYLLPGERARVRVTEGRTGYARGSAVELLEASPLRVVPRCRHFGECGGCHYQHLAYGGQLEAKQQVLREQLARLAGLEDPPLLEPLPSPAPWNYRNHLRFHRAAAGGPGFRAFRSSRVVPIVECYLPEPALAARWPQLPPSPPGRRWILRRGSGGPPAAWQQEESSPRAEAARLASAPPPGAVAPGARGRPAADGPRPVHFQLPYGSFRVSPQSFFQANTPMAALLAGEVLRQLLRDLQDRAGGAAVLDLYCGVGLFSRALAPHVGQVVGVELSPAACADFRRNRSSLDNVRLVPGDVRKVLPRLALRPAAVVADPPRAGLGPAVVRALAALAPGLLVYVSCDPATLARDARELGRQGYRLRSIRLLDLFPQTYHLETLSVWSRPPGSAILVP
jgi:23S rRNA (uracil1939-C5)-methyltransferase